MKRIVGLGNPGRQYASTRHNVGFMVVEKLRRTHRQPRWSRALPLSAQCVIRMGGAAVRLMRPLTMMNRSGEAFVAAVPRWRVAPAELLLVCDDVNLPLGTVRLRPRGSAGGHHGLASCLEHLGTEEIPRLRIGIGVQPLPKDLTDFVLSSFRAEERPMVHRTIARAAETCELWVTEGIQAAMNRANARNR